MAKFDQPPGMIRKHAIGCYGSYLDIVDRWSRPDAFFSEEGWFDPSSELLVTRADFVRTSPTEMRHYLGRVATVSRVIPGESALEDIIQATFDHAPDILAGNAIINAQRPNPLKDSVFRRRIISPNAKVSLQELMAGIPVHSSFSDLLRQVS